MTDQSNRSLILSSIATISGNPIEDRPDLDTISVFDFGIDSLNVVELIFLLEAELGVEIPLTEFDEDAFRSINHLDAHLRRLQVETVSVGA